MQAKQTLATVFIRVFIGVVITALMLAASTAAAQDIFVKPTTNPTHPADLGITTRPKAAPVTPTTSPSVQQHQQPSPAPVVPIPQHPTEQAIPNPPPQPVTPSSKAEIVTIDDTPAFIPPGQGPNSFSVSIQPGVIGQAEAADIQTTLGLTPQQAASNCGYEHLVVLGIDDAGNALQMGRLTTAQQKFSGTAKSVDVFPTIACRKLRQPISGMIIEQGNFYKISATAIQCPTPPRAGSIKVNFKYLGNGQGMCQYQ